MKKYFFIFFVLFYADTAFSHSHNPITRDSLEAINVPNLDEDGVPLSIESSELLSGISD